MVHNLPVRLSFAIDELFLESFNSCHVLMKTPTGRLPAFALLHCEFKALDILARTSVAPVVVVLVCVFVCLWVC